MIALIKREFNMFMSNRTIIFSICGLLILAINNDIVIVSGSVNTAIRCFLFSWYFIEPTLICLNNENKNKGDCYFAALPFSRTQLTLVKYLYFFLTTVIFIVLGTINYYLCIPGLSVMVSFFVVPLVPLLISLPIYYWLGGVKGTRCCTLTVILGVILFSVINSLLSDYIKSAFVFNKGFPVLLLVISVAFICSFLLSVHLYKKRDI